MPEDQDGEAETLVAFEVYATVPTGDIERAKQEVETMLYACLGAGEDANVPGAHGLQYRFLYTV